VNLWLPRLNERPTTSTTVLAIIKDIAPRISITKEAYFKFFLK